MENFVPLSAQRYKSKPNPKRCVMTQRMPDQARQRLQPLDEFRLHEREDPY